MPRLQLKTQELLLLLYGGLYEVSYTHDRERWIGMSRSDFYQKNSRTTFVTILLFI